LNLQPPVLETGALPVELRPSVAGAVYRGPPRSTIGRVAMVGLFTAITLAFVLIAVWTFSAGRIPLGVAATALAAWMATLAWSALRKSRP
jgi:hypothetical protein